MPARTTPQETGAHILSIDIGGSHVKATVLNSSGDHLTEYKKLPTPADPGPGALLKVICEVTAGFRQYDHISVGFPGFVKNGVVMTAPNLGTNQWEGTDFRKIIEEALGKPTRLVNDADMQGLGVIEGRGLEMVITLGTGFGTALFYDGQLLPHLEVAHHPICKEKDYDQYIGDEALAEIGEKKWNERMRYVFGVLKTVFNYDLLYIGGGNAGKLDFEPDKNMVLINNRKGIRGGARLWFPLKKENATL